LHLPLRLRTLATSPDAASAAVLESARFDHALALDRMRIDGDRGVDLIGFGLAVLGSVVFR
jgi:hypothetical protein